MIYQQKIRELGATKITRRAKFVLCPFALEENLKSQRTRKASQRAQRTVFRPKGSCVHAHGFATRAALPSNVTLCKRMIRCPLFFTSFGTLDAFTERGCSAVSCPKRDALLQMVSSPPEANDSEPS